LVGDKGESGCGDAIPGETAASLANKNEGAAELNGVDRDDSKFATRSPAGFVTGEGDIESKLSGMARHSGMVFRVARMGQSQKAPDIAVPEN